MVFDTQADQQKEEIDKLGELLRRAALHRNDVGNAVRKSLIEE